MIEITNLVKSYGDFIAVDRLSLHVGAGEILGLVGPNGAGKTSTLRCLAGILPATSGSIHVGGFEIAKQPIEARRQLAFIPDEPKLFEQLTVWDYLLVVGRIYGVPDVAERGAQLLEELGLADRRDSFPDELSRGMKQKLMLAAALLHRPKVIIFDEPLTGLDPRAIRLVKQTIVDVAKDGAAIIVSSHLLSLVEEISSRILLVQRGRKLLEGTIDDIRAAHTDLHPDADLEDIFLRVTEEGEGE